MENAEAVVGQLQRQGEAGRGKDKMNKLESVEINPCCLACLASLPHAFPISHSYLISRLVRLAPHGDDDGRVLVSQLGT